jgi:transcriptional regulator with XRE-family HTH domain
VEINSEKLKLLREGKFWSQDELAIAAGLSLRTIQRAEREGVASLQSLKAMAAALNVDSAAIQAPKTSHKTSNKTSLGAGDAIADTVESEQPSAVGAASNQTIASALSNKRLRFTGYRMWLMIGTAIVVAGIASGFFLRRDDYVDRRSLEDLSVTDRPEDMPFDERILGHWESSSSGQLSTLDIDKKSLDINGDARIKARYTLLENSISYGIDGRIISARVVFDSPTEMIWTTDGPGTVVRYTRNKIVMPSRREVYASMKGVWFGTGAIQAIDVWPDKLHMTFADGAPIEATYAINGLRLSINRNGAVEHYAISFGESGQMIWTKVFTAEGYTFVREKP